MNHQAFPDIETISVRVEERRLGVKGPGNWRVHEFSGFEAIPASLRPAFASGEEGETHALALDAKLREIYQRRREQCQFEEPYEVPCAAEPGRKAAVARTVTMTLRYRRRQPPVRWAA